MLDEKHGDLVAAQSAPRYRLSIVIVTYNSADVLSGLLDSLPAGLAGIKDFEVVVVDNDSRDDSVELARSHPIAPKVICMGRNAGYAAGINAAAAAFRLDGDVLVLNPDIRLLPGSARLLLERLSDPPVGVAVPRMLNEDGSIAWSLRREPSLVTVWADALIGSNLAGQLGLGENVRDLTLYEKGGNADWATGAVLAIAARARRRIGSWDESFFLYSEEVDYLRRIRDIGLAVAYVPRAEVIHIGGEYHDNPRLSALMTVNRIGYFRRHHGVFATWIFRLAILFGATMRFAKSRGYRAAFWAALRPWKSPAEILNNPEVRVLSG